MTEWIVTLVRAFPPELATVILAAVPVTEMRASIPLALTAFGLPAWRAVAFSIVGNLLPIPVLLCGLPPAIGFVERRVPAFDKLMRRYFAYLKRRHDRVQAVGGVALGAVTLLPLPGAGVWTGCLLAVLFRLSWKVSALALAVGVLVEAAIVTLITTGTLGALSWIL
jgi:uncharacterized membrane protein